MTLKSKLTKVKNQKLLDHRLCWLSFRDQLVKIFQFLCGSPGQQPVRSSACLESGAYHFIRIISLISGSKNVERSGKQHLCTLVSDEESEGLRVWGDLPKVIWLVVLLLLPVGITVRWFEYLHLHNTKTNTIYFYFAWRSWRIFTEIFLEGHDATLNLCIAYKCQILLGQI